MSSGKNVVAAALLSILIGFVAWWSWRVEPAVSVSTPRAPDDVAQHPAPQDAAVTAALPSRPTSPSPTASGIRETQLPLELVGTVLFDDEERSEAVVRYTDREKRMVLRRGDSLAFHPAVDVEQVLARRIVLRTPSGLEYLTMSALPADHASAKAAERRPPRTPDAPLKTTRELVESGGGPGVSEEVIASMDRMALALAVDLEPIEHENGEFSARAVHVTEGGLLDRAGIEEGETIEALDGVRVDHTEAAKRLLRDLATCNPMTAVVSGAGGERTVEITADMLNEFGCTP